MLEVIGNLWDFHQRGGWIAIPTNCVVRISGDNVMGAGLAKQAADRYQDFPRAVGQHVATGSTNSMAWPKGRLLAIPTKSHWRNPSSLNLIEQSILTALPLLQAYNISRLYCPRFGCGLGQLNWDQVRSVIAPLVDDRFVFVSPPPRV